MPFDFLTPIDKALLAQIEGLHPSCIGRKIKLHSSGELPDLSDVKIALIGVQENRRDSNFTPQNFDFTKIRLAFYKLFSGNWHLKIADLGDISAGNSIEDTEFALHEILTHLLNQNIIPVIIGGSQDLTYAQYRAHDHFGKMVNVVNVDARFDIGDTEAPINAHSYIGKMIVNKPFNLFNYANIGYQTYLNPPEEISLIEKLFFEAYRLGEVSKDIRIAEPVMRDADIVSLDIDAVASVFSESVKNQPNGFDGKEICALARYAGISDKVKSFGLYNLHYVNKTINTPLLPAEILWYFIEGVNFRKDEENIFDKNNCLKFNVPIDNELLRFYQSKNSGRWWLEIPTIVNNKLKEVAFLPCSEQDYLDACNQEIPVRWYKVKRRNEL